ncbi:hypothetical protein TG4357_01033 [Thalassovita gelatinovora]|uniref:Uncharacterized protein n=1 Tax=Thalassovita gelatinovora TaxID=53501 RepID=A0A0P1F7P9_THAGE|nr:hypothetical protein TG4357_01033 [Thalassovita gelatinovora]
MRFLPIVLGWIVAASAMSALTWIPDSEASSLPQVTVG